MPNYEYECSQCGQVTVQQRPIAQRNDAFDCPDCKSPTIRCQAARGFSYTMNIRKHVPESFKDVLRNIKSKHRGSTIEV